MNQKLLLVDDDADVLDRVARLLGRRYDVAVAPSGAEGLEQLAREPRAVVLTDFDMPDMDGLEFLERAAEAHPATVGVMLTGVSDRQLAIRAFEGGHAYRFVDKPATFERLCSAIDAAIEEHQRRLQATEETERHQFSCKALIDLLENLELRLRTHTGALDRMQRFVHDLSTAESLERIADIAAQAANEMLGQRGIFVELVDVLERGQRCQALAGPSLGQERVRSEVSSHEGNIGTLEANSRDRLGRVISEADRHMLAAIAATTAVAVHNQLRRRERDDAQHATIMAMALLAEKRDNETGRHLERVSEYSRLVAEGLRREGHFADVIDDEWIQDLYCSVPLHDIGKVGIPDRILLKTGKLDADEWEIMKQHTTIGAQTLKSVMGDHARSSLLEMGLEIAWCHHEKWDGSGYPRGLKGDGIPLSARILSLADVYDALTTVRPYKRAWTHEQALEWIADGSGTHFDPRVVAVFVDRAERANEIRARLADLDGAAAAA